MVLEAIIEGIIEANIRLALLVKYSIKKNLKMVDWRRKVKDQTKQHVSVQALFRRLSDCLSSF